MYRILLLSSAAIAMSACSMNGEGTYYDPAMMASGPSSSSYYSGCAPSNCAQAQPYAVGHAQQSHSGYGHAPTHHQSAYGGQRPDAHAYGSQVQGHHGAHGAPQLRGRHGTHRQGYKYGTLGGVMYDVDTDVYGLQGRLGYQSAGIFGGEVEGSIGVNSDSETLGATTTELEVDYQVGAFATARALLGDRFSVLGRLGYAATRLSAEIDDGVTVVEGSDTFDGIAYGVAAEYAFDPRNSVRVDYTRYDLDGLGGTTDSVALAFARKF